MFVAAVSLAASYLSPPRAAAEAPLLVVPQVGDRIVIPAVELAGADFLVAYRHGHHAYVATNGYDTDVIRFWDQRPDGALRDARIARRMMDGEYDVDIIGIARASGEARIVSDRSTLGWSECVLSFAGGTLVAKGKDFSFSYSASAGKGLRIERRFGERVYVEEWGRDGSSAISDSAGGGSKGCFEGPWPRPDRYVERPDSDPSGESDTVYSFFDVEGGIKFRAESAEPLGECLVAGLGRSRPEGISLEDLALMDLVLGLDRRITPLLARLYLGGQ